MEIPQNRTEAPAILRLLPCRQSPSHPPSQTPEEREDVVEPCVCRPRLRVVVAEDHHAVLERLLQVLSSDFDVVAAVADGRSAVAESIRLSPDVLICDISMPGLDGFRVARELKRSRPEISIVFWTANDDPAYVSEAFQVPVSGYVVKKGGMAELKAAVRAAAAGERYLSSRLRAPADSAPLPPPSTGK